MTMAAAYATVAARGVYCSPIAISKILTIAGSALPVKSADCHQVIPQGRRRRREPHPAGRAGVTGHRGRREFTQHGVVPPQAGKTGTANGFEFTPRSAATRHAGRLRRRCSTRRNPTGDARHGLPATGALPGRWTAPARCSATTPGRSGSSPSMHADLGKSIANFVAVPANSPYYSMGTGVSSPKPPKPPKPP